MISSNAQEETITYFLFTLRVANPSVKPKWIMSDKDRAEMNSIRHVFPESKLHQENRLATIVVLIGP
jgi:hypothetical protein